jgi:hypothetical protein
VGVNGSFSGWTEVRSGVPQGSVLGPALFVCYINDLPETISSFVYMYADDTKIFRRVDKEQEVSTLQRDLDQLVEWTQQWQLSFNTEKCKVMHMGGNRNGEAKYKMEGVNKVIGTLQVTTEEKDLGVWITNTLKPSNHIAHIVQRANQTLGLIRRTFTYMDCRLMKQLFTSLVRPQLEYANVVWHPCLKKDIESLEKVQHRATRMVPGLAKLPYEERLKRMDLPSLTYRRTRGDAIEVYKYLHGIYKVDSTTMLPLEISAGMKTRGHTLKLEKRRCRTQLRSNFFGFRVVDIWNSLPDSVVTATSTNVFKHGFDCFGWRNRFCEEWQVKGRYNIDPGETSHGTEQRHN